MAQFETIRSGTGARTAAIDEGLRAHMNKVYGTMSIGMLLTFAAAWAVGNNAAMMETLFTGFTRYIVMFAPLIMVFAFAPIVARFAVKPTSSILTPRRTINRAGEEIDLVTKGRHDPCVGIRAVPVAEAMMACVVLDHLLLHRGQVGDGPRGVIG
mgnify:CR=1 FL=1